MIRQRLPMCAVNQRRYASGGFGRAAVVFAVTSSVSFSRRSSKHDKIKHATYLAYTTTTPSLISFSPLHNPKKATKKLSDPHNIPAKTASHIPRYTPVRVYLFFPKHPDVSIRTALP